jgi:hypothetical protein
VSGGYYRERLMSAGRFWDAAAYAAPPSDAPR